MILGLDLGATNVKAALVDARGRVVAHAAEPLGKNAAALAPDEVADALARCAERCVRDWAAVRLVGVGAPGAVKGGAITGCANLFRGAHFPVPLAALVVRRLHRKRTVLVNDADAAALAERWVGAARGVERAAVLTLGTGVGCGLFLGADVPLRGVEAGHASVGGPDGRTCSCGARGCLEAYAAAPAIVKAFGGTRTCREVVALAAAGDARAASAVDGAARHLAVGCLDLCRTLDVGVVVLTGGVARAGPPFLEAVRRHARLLDWTCLPGRADRVVLGAVAHAGCVGAARAALNEAPRRRRYGYVLAVVGVVVAVACVRIVV